MANQNPTPPPEHSRFKPGESGNPGGKPVGARNRLQAAFVDALADDFERHGLEAIEQCRTRKPDVYLRVISMILPREIDLTAGGEMPDQQKQRLIESILARLYSKSAIDTQTPVSMETAP
jgi:hypothetical protein